MRERLWQKLKDTPNLYFWDVYIWEAHPGDPMPPPKTWAERIRNFEKYRKDEDMTMQCLIDTIGDPWSKDSFWKSRPTSFYCMGVDGKIKSSINFMLAPGYYTQIESYIKKALEDVEEDNVKPEIEVKAPIEDEVIAPGSKYEIKWEASDNNKVVEVALYFSEDNGANWEVIDSGNANTGKYEWTVPSTKSFADKCKIKVLALDGGRNSEIDESGTFKIGVTNINNFNTTELKNVIKLLKIYSDYMLSIPFPGENKVSIIDVKGKQVSTFTTVNNKYLYKIPRNIAIGIHLISIKTANNRIITKKLWLMR